MRKFPKYRLADSTVVEPLVNRWPAWAHVISPLAASLHLLNYQIETLRSYLREPESHLKANRDQELIGGPFANIPLERADEIRQLLEFTEQNQSHNIRFARSAIEFHNWLVGEAKGQSLEPFYQFIPDPLRGYVELVYDYYNRATVRFLEGLLYESRYYDEGLQSLRLWKLKRDDVRPFFMSTPRLPDVDQIEWRIAFDDSRVDELFKLDVEPQQLSYIREIIGLDSSDDHRLLPLLSAEPARFDRGPDRESIRLRYFGHACVLVEYNGVSILTDPFVSAIPEEGGLDRFSYRDLPERIDYAIVTHNHQDHFALEGLLRLRHRTDCLIVPRSHGFIWGDISLKLMARKLGFKNVVEMDALERIGFPGGEIIAIPFFGEHGDLGHSKSAYVIRAGDEQILFAADSDCLDRRMYERVRDLLGPIKTVFLGMECVGAPLTWSCGPLFPQKPDHAQDQTRRYHGSDANAGMEILGAVGARRFYNYAMGMEPWLEHLLGLNLRMDSTQIRESNKLLARTRGRGFLAAERLYGKGVINLDGQSPKSEAAKTSYWTSQLDGAPPVELPADRRRTRTAASGAATHRVRVPKKLTKSLKELSRSEGVSLSTTLLAAFQISLFGSSNQQDLLIETAVDGGDSFDVTLPLRTDLSGDPSFRDLMGRAHEVVSLADACKDGAGAPGAGSNQMSGSRAIFLFGRDRFPGSIRFDLALSLVENEQRLKGSVDYNGDMLDATTVATFCRHLENVLKSAVAHPDWRLSDFASAGGDEEICTDAVFDRHGASDVEDQFAF